MLYYGGDYDGSMSVLASAGGKIKALQVPDVPLVLLREMGYSQKEAVRALRFSGGDMDAAITFIGQQRAAERVGSSTGMQGSVTQEACCADENTDVHKA